MNISLLQILLGIFFLTIVFLHLAKKNVGIATAYGLQSFAVVMILFNSFLETGETALLFIVLLVFMVKVILAPMFFIRLIKKNKIRFSVSTYLSTPLILMVLAVLTAVAYSQKLTPFSEIISANHSLSALSLAAIFLSLFLIVNRKGALSQIVGILSFENSIVAFAIFAGLEQSPVLQVGIIFDISIWLVIATIFVSMIYKHFGTLNVTSMKHLKD